MNNAHCLQLGDHYFNYTTNAQGCYISTLKPTAKGYVQVYTKGRKLYLHRLAYAEHNTFLKVRRLTHTCGNRNCFNPNHVTILRASGNTSGSNNPNAKINEDIAREIYLAEGTQKDIAKRFNTSVRLVGKIKRKEAWTNAIQGL
jgi:hypothetical protein